MRKPPPKNRLTFPVDMVLQHPAVIAAPGAAYSAVITLCVVYWSMGCRDLPSDETSLQSLARLSSPAWFRVKADVRRTLAAILPLLRQVYDERVTAYEGSQRAAHAGGHARGIQIRREKQTARAELEANGTSPAPVSIPLPRTKQRRQDQPDALPIAHLQAIDKTRAAANAAGPSVNAFRD